MGGMISGAGQIAMGIENASQGNQNALNNYDLQRQALNQNIVGVQDQGNFAAAKARMQGAQMVAAQRLAYANSGVDEKSGTPAAVQADTQAAAELDAQTAKNNAAREAWGLRLDKKVAWQNAQTTIGTNNRAAAGSFITGASQFVGSGITLGGS